MPYSEFAAEVDKRVKEAMDDGAPISIVGCRLPQMTAEGGRQALKLFDMVHALTRESDLTSTKLKRLFTSISPSLTLALLKHGRQSNGLVRQPKVS